MRKSKIVLLLALVLATVMMLSSCGFGAFSWEDALLTVTPEATTSYTAATKIADLNDAVREATEGDLVYFTARTDSGMQKHVVYNTKLNRTVFSAVESENTTISVELVAFYQTAVIEVVTYTEALDTGITTQLTALYTPDGTKLAESKNPNAYYEIEKDLLYFEGKYYGAKSNGEVVFAFDYSGAANRPNITDMTAEYYYDVDGDYIAVYSRNDLSLVASCLLPSDYMENFEYCVLSNGNVLVQYLFVEPDTAEDYTMIDDEGKKYTLTTLIFDVESNKIEEIEADYWLDYGFSAATDYEQWQDLGINEEEIYNAAVVYMIENERVNFDYQAMRFVSLSDKGAIQDVLEINGEYVQFVDVVAENKWIVHTYLNNAYLIDNTGKVLADITNAHVLEKMIIADGVIYGMDMNVLYNFGADGATLIETFANGVLLRQANGDVAYYTNGNTIAITAITNTAVTYYESQDNYFVVRDASDILSIKYIVYNDLGAKIATIEANDIDCAESMIRAYSIDGVAYYALH